MRIRYFIGILILLIIVTSIGYGFLFREVTKKNAEAAMIRQEIESEDEREFRLRLLEKEIEETSSERFKIEKLFIESDGAIDFIESLEGLAEESGITLSIDSLGTEPEPNGFEKLKVLVKAEGSWAEVYKFMSLLETMPLPLTWKRASFGKNDSDDNLENWIFSADFEVLKIK